MITRIATLREHHSNNYRGRIESSFRTAFASRSGASLIPPNYRRLSKITILKFPVRSETGLRVGVSIPKIVITLAIAALSLFPTIQCHSQSSGLPDGVNIGYPINGVFSGGSIDSVQLNNGNLHVDIPLLKISGVGIPISIHFIYDTQIWNYASDDTQYFVKVDRQPGEVTYPGHVEQDNLQSTKTETCYNNQQYANAFVEGITFLDEDGTAHQFPMSGYEATSPPCDYDPAPSQGYALDASGIRGDRATNQGFLADVITKNGTKYTFPTNSEVDVEDSNGNKLTAVNSGSGSTYTTTLTDSAGRTFTISGPYERPTSIQYKDSNGATQTISIAYTQLSPAWQALCGVGYQCNGPGPIFAPTSITFPDQSRYTFQYYSTGLNDLQSITLPTGAIISYTYGNPGTRGETVLTRTVVSDGQSSEWQYQYNVSSSQADGQANIITVTDPYNNDTRYTCTIYGPKPEGLLGGSRCYMTQEQVFRGPASSGNVIVTKNTAYTITGVIMPTSTTVTWAASGQTAETDTSWDVIPNSGWYSGADNSNYDVSWGNPLSKKEYDYGTGSHGVLLRNTQYTYLHEQNSSYIAPNIADRVEREAIYNSLTMDSSTLVSETTTNYDQFNQSAQNGLLSTNGTTTNHDPSFNTSYTARGLPTSVTRYVGQGLPSITTYTDYNDIGSPTVSTDARGKSTTYQYGTENAFLSSVTYPSTEGVSHVTYEEYDLNTGLLIWKKDWNLNNKTNYSYDARLRPLLITYPDNGSINYSYPDPNHIDMTVAQSPDPSIQRVRILDGLGREQETTETTGTSGTLSYTYTAYDLLGRKHQVYNPTLCSPPTSNCGESTWGYTTYSYDALSRPVSEENSDGTIKYWCYDGSDTNGQPSGRCHGRLSIASTGEWVDMSDELGNEWQQIKDAAGRLTSVVEPNGTSQAPAMETDYTYDALGNLTSVTQSGSRDRSFSYDGLSRLVQAYNPEKGWVCYGTTGGVAPNGSNCTEDYDGNGNLLAKTNARSITTHYSYDDLNRLSSKRSTDGAATPAACYQYDISSQAGPDANLNGQLANEWTQSADANGGTCATTMPTSETTLLTSKSILLYDPMGRIKKEQTCVYPTCTTTLSQYPMSYTYDLAGNITSYTNGNDSILYTNTYDNAGRLASISSNWNDGTHPGCIFSAQTAPSPGCSQTESAPYGLFGGLTNAIYGTGITINRSYDNRLRVTGETDTGPQQ